MARPRDPRFEYVTDAAGRVRKMERITCGQCGEPATVRTGGHFCSKTCAVLNQHAEGKSRQVSGSEHYAWKGDDAGYKSFHMRVIRTRGSADHCEWRSKADCKSRKYEWAHLHETSPGDAENYVSLCKTCHQEYDGQQGSGHANAKLTDEQVAVIRGRYDAGDISQQALAAEFGVDQTTISSVVSGRRYR